MHTKQRKRLLWVGVLLGLAGCSPAHDTPLLKIGTRYKIGTNIAVEVVTVQRYVGHGWYQVVGPDGKQVLFNSNQAVVIAKQ